MISCKGGARRQTKAKAAEENERQGSSQFISHGQSTPSVFVRDAQIRSSN
jgi:hypothetical protein